MDTMTYKEAMEEAHKRAMGEAEKVYICIDLKSFYASVECVERGLDPMTTDLVVADPDRTDKTICLAVSPSLKAQGVSGRARVFEIPKHLKYIMAKPRMSMYIKYAANIYGVYLDYISPDDMHVYSIDEVFIDATRYLSLYGFTPREMADFLMNEVYKRIGVRATAGIGTNMYLAKIALDITAKHSPDFIGYLDQQTYINTLWNHKPLRDFWMIGPGISRRLERIGIDTMAGIAKADEDLLYKIFGINAELLIDHAWGVEPTEISDIKGYETKSNSLSHGQVLTRDYTNEEGELILKEMVEQLCLEVTELNKKTKNVSIAVGYSNALKLPLTTGSASFNVLTNALGVIMPAMVKVYGKITNPIYPVRRIFVNFNDIKDAGSDAQMTIFDIRNNEMIEEGRTSGARRKESLSDLQTASHAEMERDSTLQAAVNEIKKKYGKDAMFRGMDLEDAATTRERNHQVGGHKA